MSKQKTLIFVGAHPDDETFGMGGTLAKYVQMGVRVYYACATRGEAGTIDPKFMAGYATPGDLRWAELQCAAKTLGLTDVLYLGYRDSGMPGAEDNKHPQALINAPVEEVAGRIVKIVRELKPEVVVTFDPIGGYRHPDHIATHNAAIKAFYAAGDPKQYPEFGPVFQPSKLYYGVFPHRLMRFAVKIMPIFGENPHKFGRNKDIDLTDMVKVQFPIHTVVRLTPEASEIRGKATNCHASQLDGSPRQRGLLSVLYYFSGLTNRIFGERDYYMRAYPAPKGKKREADLFEGVG